MRGCSTVHDSETLKKNQAAYQKKKLLPKKPGFEGKTGTTAVDPATGASMVMRTKRALRFSVAHRMCIRSR